MDKLLTVVVPAYNAENYIKKNLDSLCLNELEDELEVLVVDDGSSDYTGQIADDYEQRFSKIVKVIHKKNGGHGSGINKGVECATGKYFKVVDADDWLDRQGLENLVEELRACDDDAVVSGFYWVFDNGSGCEESFSKKAEIREPFPGVVYRKSYNFNQIANQIYLKMHGVTWRTDLLRQMNQKIDENCFYVDAEYILYPIPLVKKIRFIRDFVYQYRIGREGQSISQERMIRNKENYDRVISSLLSFYDECRNSDANISSEKICYIEKGIARIISGKIKIMLSLPSDIKNHNLLIDFDTTIKNRYPKVYQGNQNRAVWLLRKSRYFLYGPMSWMVQRREH